MSLHPVLVAVHAVAAVLSLLLGLLALRWRRLLAPHLATLLLMTASLAGAVAVDLATGAAGRWVFAGLLVLAVGMCVSSGRALRLWNHDRAAATSALGFSLISLVTGFVAVTVIGAGWPVVAVVAAIGAPVLLGRLLVRRAVLSARRAPAASTATRPPSRSGGSPARR